MNRRNWWAMIVTLVSGKVMAQTVQIPPGISAVTCVGKEGLVPCCKPNGECPVCGTMAEPYIVESKCIVWKVNTLRGYTRIECVKDDPIPTIDNPPRLVDCKHCRNAFYQDAEK